MRFLAGFSVLGVIFLTGCMATGSGSPIQSLRNSSMIEVRAYAYRLDAYIQTGVSVDEAIQAVKNTVANRMRDPDSTKFRNVRIKPFEGGKIACGEVNSKNAYGGYVGYQRFVASHTDFTLEDNDTRRLEISNASNAGFYAACVH